MLDLLVVGSLSLSALSLLFLILTWNNGTHIHHKLREIAYNAKMEHLRDITRGKFLG